MATPAFASAGERIVGVWLWVEGDGVRVRFGEPIVNSWWLPADPAPVDYEAMITDGDLARLERFAKLSIRYEKKVGEAFAEQLRKRLESAGFTKTSTYAWPMAGEFSRLRRKKKIGRSLSWIHVSMKADRVDPGAGRIAVEIRMRLRVCKVDLSPAGDDAGGEVAWTENCNLERTWSLPGNASASEFLPLIRFLEPAFRSRPVKIRAGHDVDAQTGRNFVSVLESAGFRYVDFRHLRPPASGGTRRVARSPWSPTWREIWRGKGASRGGLLVGLNYSFGLTPSTLKDYLYPSFGWSYDWNRFHLDVICPLPWLFIDFVAGGIGYIAGGGDLTLPLWDGLNDEDEPGRAEMLTLRARYAFFAADGHKLDAGILFDVWQVSPWVHDRFVGLINADLAPSVGYGYSSKHFGMNLALDAGNGFNQISNWNPFVGADLMCRFRLGEIAGLYLKVMFRAQRFDYHDYTPSGNVPDPEVYRISRWEKAMAVDAGLYFYVMD
jgi:hypothetical protein